MRSQPIESHSASAICTSWEPVRSKSGRGAIRLTLSLSSGPAKGEALRFYYSPGYPFQDALISRHELPTEASEMDIRWLADHSMSSSQT